MEVFEQAMKNVMPVLEVRARRVGGSNYQVPMEVRPERRQTLGLRFSFNTRANAAKKRWKKGSQMKYWMLQTIQAAL